ncbi:MAG TPA: glycosyltransferase [Patescibacteria group bacterium]|nr:glycosyltransferase [Patescibacteria group bacterium]
MRILKVTQSYYPFLDRGGPAVKVRALARGLAARGHSVTVLTTDLGRGTRYALGEKCEWGWRRAEDNTEIIYLPTALTFRALTVNPRLPAFCRRRLAEYDVVHIYGLYDLLGPTVAWWAARRRVPYWLEPMGMFRPIDRAFFLKRVWHDLLGTRMTAGAERIIATAELEREELIEEGIPAGKVLVRPNPVDLAEYRTLPPRGGFRGRWEIAPDEPLVLFLSRLIPRKGADLLIEAFAEALPEGGTLAVAGPEGQPGYLNYLRGVAERCGVAARVRFPGGLYGEEKKEVFADADVFALPSSYENFANAVAEAVASGVPAVITATCGIHSLIQGRAGLVVAREKKAVAGALRELVLNRALRKQLRSGCAAVAAELSPEKTVCLLERFYEEGRR